MRKWRKFEKNIIGKTGQMIKLDHDRILLIQLKERVQYYLRNGTQVRSNIVYGIFLEEKNCFKMKELDGEATIEMLIPLENVKGFNKWF